MGTGDGTDQTAAAAQGEAMKLKRGEIWLVDLEPARRGEVGKTRPCIVISEDRYNEMAAAPLVMPISTYPAGDDSPAIDATASTGLSQDSSVVPLHIRAVGRS